MLSSVNHIENPCMNTVWRIALVLILLSCLGYGCSKSTKHENIGLTPQANEEAELISLYLSGELVAPDWLYGQVLEDLTSIRSTFGDDFDAITRTTFMPPWVVSCIIIGFDDTTAQKVANGEYHDWDAFNEKYQVIKIDTGFIQPMDAVVLYFKGRLHPRRLAEQYAILPGVKYTGPNGLFGDWPNIYPRKTRDGITYLFRNGWGDCPSGCIHNEYWYFISKANQPVFIGHWTRPGGPPEPDWWFEARLNIELYHRW